MDTAAVLAVQVKVDGILQAHRKVEQFDDSMSRTAKSVDRDAQKIEKALGGVGKTVRETTDLWQDAQGRWRRANGQFATTADKLAAGLRDVGGGGRDGAGGLNLASHAFGKFSGAVAAAMPLLVGAGAQTVALVSALGPLVGLAPAAGHGLLALAQGAGVLKLATLGVGDALKEQIAAQSTAGAQAIRAAGQERNAARAIESAQEGVRTARERVADAARRVADAVRAEGMAEDRLSEAQRNALRAQEALTDARRAARMELTDLKDRVGDLALAEQQGINKLAQLRRELAANTAPEGDLERQELVLDIQDAERSLIDIRRDQVRANRELDESQKRGINGARQVVAAQEQIRDADRQVIDAKRGVRDAERATADARRDQARAARDVTRAIEAVRDAELDARDSAVAAAAGAGKLAEEFDKLPPAAQSLVRTLLDLKPRFDELRNTAAAGLLPGVESGLRAAMGSFDETDRVVGKTATTLGGLADQAGKLVGSSAFGRDLETIGNRNAKIIGIFGDGALHLVSALRHVLVAAGPLATWLARTAQGWAENADQSARAGRESGRLADFFDKTRDRAKLLGSILSNLAGGLLGIGKASDETGVKILHDLDRLTARFAGWANSVRGRNEIAAFMEKAHAAMKDIWPAVGALIKAFASFSVTILPAYARAVSYLAPILDELVALFIAWKLIATGAAIATGLWTAATKIATAATKVWAGAQWLLNAALAANPITLVLLAISALVAGFIYAWKNSETFRDIVTGAWEKIRTVAVDVFGFLAGFLADTWDVIRTVAAGAWSVIRDAIVNPIVGAFSFIKNSVVLPVVGWLANRWRDIETGASTGWGLIKTAIITPPKAGFEFLKNNIVGPVVGWLDNRWENIKTGADKGWGLIKAAIIDPVKTAFEFIKDEVIKPVVGWLSEQWDKITLGAKVFALVFGNRLERGFAGVANVVIGFVNAIISALNVIPGVDIGKIDKLAVPERLSVKDATDKAQGLAKGGAYARTGGLVNTPITLMGEEAPRHPEFVIPTNPAYRSRAQKLAMQAAQAVGLAQGGVYSQRELERLWVQAGGPKGQAHIASAVAMAESGGRASVVNSIGAGGLWQIHPPEPGYLDPLTNARIAVRKWNESGWRPWEAFTGPDGQGDDGPFRQFLNGSVGKVAQFGGVDDLIRSVLGKLPNPVELLPRWLQGMGRWAIDKATGFIKSGGFGEHNANRGVVHGTLKIAQRVADMFGLRISSTFRDVVHNAAVGGVPGSLHTHGTPENPGAVDLVGARIMDALRWVRENLSLAEALVHDVGSGLHLHMGFFRKGGLFSDAVLGSYETGTPYVPRTGPYLLHEGEAVIPAGQNRGPGGPAVHVENMYVQEREDIHTVAARLAWLHEQAGA